MKIVGGRSYAVSSEEGRERGVGLTPYDPPLSAF